MERILDGGRLPWLLAAVAAIVIALAGTAFGGSDAISSISTKTVKKVVTKQINQLAPGLSVSHANTAGTATKADTAADASKAANADHAANADNASNASNAARVGGASVCSGTLSLQNNDVKTICQAGTLRLEASCGINPGSTDVALNLKSDGSTSSDAWAFGTTVDAGGVVQIAEPFFGGSQVTLAEGLDLNNSPLTADGQGASFSAGTPTGSSLSGDVSVLGNLTGTSQGTCSVTMGATAR